MHRDMTEINVEQARVGPGQDLHQRFELDARDLPWLVEQLPKPEAPQKVRSGFVHNIDRIEWENIDVLAFLRDYNRPNALEGGDLPVDVQHLRLQECRTIRCDDGPRLG